MISITIQNILGVFLLVAPFLFVVFWKDKKKAFLQLLFFWFLFHIVFNLTTQFFGVFYYLTAVLGNIAFIACIFLWCFFTKKKASFDFKKIDWMIVFIFLVAFLCFYQIHFNYSGKISLATDNVPSYHNVFKMVYPYPYFSDEWYAVSFVKTVISTHGLPLIASISKLEFVNLEMFFHSLISGFFLVVNINPVFTYTTVSIFFNILIVILAYVILRINDVKKIVAGISSLSIIYIVSGANLPGIWHFIPVTSGVILFLLALGLLFSKKIYLALATLVMGCFFYPPFIFLYAILFALFLIFETFWKKVKDNYKTILLWLIVSLPVIFFLAVVVRYTAPIFATSRIFFLSFSGFNRPRLFGYNIIPFNVIIFALISIPFLYKKSKWFFGMVTVCTLYWIGYLLTQYRFFVEFERVVYISSILFCIASAFGFQEFLKFLDKKFSKTKVPISRYVLASSLLIFVILIPFYTYFDGWKDITYTNVVNRSKLYPKSQANKYLIEEDLNIFKDIRGKNFLSIPWKGTVIGVTTDNFPAVTKEGTVSLGEIGNVDNFMKSSCLVKQDMAKEMKLDYIYITEFLCQGFEEVTRSSEGFILYKVQK